MAPSESIAQPPPFRHTHALTTPQGLGFDDFNRLSSAWKSLTPWKPRPNRESIPSPMAYWLKRKRPDFRSQAPQPPHIATEIGARGSGGRLGLLLHPPKKWDEQANHQIGEEQEIDCDRIPKAGKSVGVRKVF